MKRVFGIAFLLIVLAGAASANEAIWREGEDATATTTFNHNWFETDSAIDFTLLSPGVPGTATKGKWVSHYTSANQPAYWQIVVNVAEGGNYTWWARLEPVNALYDYSIDGGAAQHVDMSHQHEVIDVIRPGINDVEYVGWVRVATGISLSPGTHTVRLTAVYNPAHPSGPTTIGGVDAICLVNYQWSPTGAIRPTGTTNPDPTPGPAVWFPLHIAEDAFSGSSIIDLTSVVDANTGIPAGKYGHVTRVADHFELSNRLGTPVKFWGSDLNPPDYSSSAPGSAEFTQQARFYVKHGVNLIRPNFMFSQLGESLDATKLDAYDKWFSVLKANGIYTDWSIIWSLSAGVSAAFVPAPDATLTAQLTGAGITFAQLWNELPSGGGSTKSISGMQNFVTAYQQGVWNWESTLLQHTNPYTGMRYVDDPALAIIEVQNEDNIFFHDPLNTLADGTALPNHTKLLKYLWFQWLGTKYATDALLKTAWGAGWMSGDSVVTFNPNMKIYHAWELYATGPFNAPSEKARAGDFIRFLADTQRAAYQYRFDGMTTLGYQGIKTSTGWYVGGPASAAANQWANDAGDAIDRHAYMGGGAGSYRVITGAVNNDIQLSDPGNFILPATVYGTSSSGGAPNESVYQIEDKPAVTTEWDDSAVTQWRAEISPLFAFYGMGLQGWDASFHFAGSYAWMETAWPGQGTGPGFYVTETPLYMAQFPALALATYRGDITEGDLAAARRMSLDDLGRGIDPLSQNLPGGGYPSSSNMYTPAEVNAIGRVTMKADASLTSGSSTKVDWNSYWDKTNKIITSTAAGGTLHQLVWDYNNRVVQVKSPMTQALIGFAGGHGAYNLGDITVTLTTPFASLIFTSLDGKPLSSSVSILVTALAEDIEMGAVYGGSGTSITAIGGPPLLLQPVQANITVGGLPISSVKVVDVYGVPSSSTVPVTGNAFTIDGTYATYYYQITRNQAPKPNIALSTNGLTASCVQGSSPVDDSFQVWNSGNAPLNYTVSKDQSWLSISPGSGTSTDSSDKKTHTVTYSTTGLAAGVYNAIITVTDTNATNNPQTINVTLTVRTPALIVSDTAVLNPVVTVGQNAISQQFKVWDGGEMPLSYVVTHDALSTWLSVNPVVSSSTGVGDKKTHTISYTTSGLSIGTYDAIITITAPEAINNPLMIAVHLTVQAPPPLIARSPTLLSPVAVHGANAPDQTFEVWNSVTGGTPLSYTISHDVAWISDVSPGTGSSTDPSDHKTHTVTYSTAGLGIGTYNGTITIAGTGVANSPQTISVQLTVNPAPPAIALNPTTLLPQCAATTDAPPQTFLVWNSSDQTLNYTISDSDTWLSESPGSGASTGPSNQQTHTVTYSTSGLAQGTYDATITVTAAGASNTPQVVHVHLAVLSAPPAISTNAVSFTPSSLKGQNAATQSLDIWNSGQGTLNYNVYVSTTEGPPGWVAVSSGSGSSTDSGHKVTHSVVFTTNAMDAGVYHAQVVIASDYATNAPLSIPVTLTITAPASIGTDTPSLNPTAVLGIAPANQQFHIWNAGTGTMDYDISTDQTWLMVGPTSGSSTGVGDSHLHTVSYGAYLGAGHHMATITIQGAGINNAPLAIPVDLNVTTPSAIDITSPADGATIDDSMVTVTGVVGVPGSFQAIWVNGVLATSTGPGFSTWQAPIPLKQVGGGAPNTIIVSTLDNAGVYNANAASEVVTGDSIPHVLGVGAGLIHHTGTAMTVNGAVVPGDVDTFQFEASAGTNVTLTAKGVGKPAPSLVLVLYDNYDQQILSRTGSKISVSAVLQGDGRYLIRLYSAGGDGGQYTLTLLGKAPNLKFTQNGSLPTQMSVFDRTLSLPKGTLLTASVASTKFQPTLTVLDPLGQAMPLGGFVTTTTGKVSLKNLPIPGGTENYLPGEYTLRVGSGDMRVGAFTLTCAGLAPTAAPDLVNYPVLLGMFPKTSVAAGAQLQLSVSGAHSGDWVLFDYTFGVAPTFAIPTSDTLINGKGSLFVTVPAWLSSLPPGTITLKVYFLDWATNEVSNKMTIQLAR